MENILTLSSTENFAPHRNDLLTASSHKQPPLGSDITISSPEDALEALRSKPDLHLLIKILHWLLNHDSSFAVSRPGPKAAYIVFTLVNDTVSDYWPILNADKSLEHVETRTLLLRCLCSVVGLGAIASRLQLLVDQRKDFQSQAKTSSIGTLQPIDEILDVLESVVQGDQFFASIWKSLASWNEPFSLKSLQWKELLALAASGKVLAIASEASHVVQDMQKSIETSRWLADGNSYASWLGRNIKCMNQSIQDNDDMGRKALSLLLRKAMTLGYKEQVIRSAFSDLISGNCDSLKTQQTLVNDLQAHEQKTFLYTLIAILSKDRLKFDSSGIKQGTNIEIKTLGGVAALIAAIIDRNSNLQANLAEWLVGISSKANAETHLVHRAVIAVVSEDTETGLSVLQKSMELFGDKLYIKHTPILHQEVATQILLILAGYCYRANKVDLVNLSHSSTYLNAISNRLGASSPQARFLGMIVGTAVSELVDPKDKRMNFGAEELNSSDGLWYGDLPKINDTIGSIEDIRIIPTTHAKSKSKAVKPMTIKNKSTTPTVSAKPTSKIVSIEEINSDSDSDSESEDLPMYEKPDSDPSDEDEDPTLVQRNKPTAPVYIRDLIAGLRDTENFDRHKLSLTNASNLIRRKAAFGTEVSDNIEELATLLVGLQDKWEIEDFPKLRLQGMIAVLTASPLKMGQWFSKTFYNGDYSMGQRASVLTTLGIGARELAGLGTEDAPLTGTAAQTEPTFPSKRLPSKLHNLYALEEETTPLNTLSSQLQKAMISPMAASAADQITGPSALKIRTFSSRMAVEKKRTKPIPNALAKIVAEGFFYPLTGRWRIHLQSSGENTTHTNPFLLTHLLKTLSLILHASGSSTFSLPQMTAEFWDFLLSIRPRASDPSVLEALLFAFLTLLDINQNDQRRLAEEHAKELLETQGWVENVFERVGGGSEEGDRIRMLAAGVLMRTREVVENFQRTLMGDMVDFM